MDDLIHGIGTHTLTPIVRRSHNNPDVEILEWHATPLAGGSTAAGVYRISGTASTVGQVQPWSLVLKILPAPAQGGTNTILPPSANPASGSYWKREFLVYAYGLLDELPTGFAAPRCFLAEERDGVCWLWLEDLGNVEASAWSAPQFATAAHHLGLFNGAWLARGAVPGFAWLNNDHVRTRAYLGDLDAKQLPSRVEALCQSSQLSEVWSAATVSGSMRLLDDREWFLRKMGELPRTFQHQDASRKNLLARRAEDDTATTLALDWGFSGIGAVGVDLAFLITGSARWFGGVTPANLPEIEHAALRSYVQGLASAGWEGDPRVVRLGYLLASVLSFPPVWIGALARPSSSVQRWLDESFRRPFDEIALRWSEVNQHIVTQADEARALMESLALT